VVVLDIDDKSTELARFGFDVVIGSGKEDVISGAQYFRTREDGGLDAIGIQIASTGPNVEDQLFRYKEEGDSESSLFLQGLSDRLAEDMAQFLHDRVRQRLGIPADVGTRWSPGYPAITNVGHNKDILRLLKADEAIGVHITEAGEFHPTGCTAALVSFHPDARYF
jgi:5-methyltetrahydrofolate--homocysteine methyltransferase